VLFMPALISLSYKQVLDGGTIGRVKHFLFWLLLSSLLSTLIRLFLSTHYFLQVIHGDVAPLGQPVVYALKGGIGEDVLHCIQKKSAMLQHASDWDYDFPVIHFLHLITTIHC
jgi:hypothetical protein